MNRLYVAVVCILLLIALVFCYQFFVQQASESLLKSIDEMDDLVKAEDWKNVKEKLPMFYDTFDQKRKMLNALIDHEEIDPLQISMAKMMTYAEHENSEDYLAESAALRIQLLHLPKRDAFTYDNLL